MSAEPLTLGVLALQGDFAAHRRALERWGARVREVRRRAELEGLDGLVLPGGETTTLIKLLHELDLWEPIRAFPDAGRPLFGTCAGLILLARRVSAPAQPSLGLLGIEVARNAYGRQVESFVVPGYVRLPPDLGGLPETAAAGTARTLATEFIFIRAPRVTAVDPGVTVLAEHAGAPLLVRQGLVLGASFHPELSADGQVEGLFVALARLARAARRREVRRAPQSC